MPSLSIHLRPRIAPLLYEMYNKQHPLRRYGRDKAVIIIQCVIYIFYLAVLFRREVTLHGIPVLGLVWDEDIISSGLRLSVPERETIHESLCRKATPVFRTQAYTLHSSFSLAHCFTRIRVINDYFVD